MSSIRRSTRQARPAAGVTAVSVEPLGAVARRCLAGCAGYEPLRTVKAIAVALRVRPKTFSL